jgi:dipeptidyl aminopeptidase/acylaminoacyl peptidase
MKLITTLLLTIALGIGGFGLTLQSSEKQFTIRDLVQIRRVADPQLSPDGRWIAYTITDTDRGANRRVSQIYLISVDGGEPQQLTNDKQSSSSPRWSPSGKRLAFVSSRDGSQQIWTMELAETAVGPLKKVSSIATGADAPVWSPDGQWIAFTSEVYPECTTAQCNEQREKQATESKVKAKITSRLLYRHWNTWKEGKRSHIFVVKSSGGDAQDLTPGDYDAPPFSLGGPVDYAFSPDSKEIAFARNTDRVEALSTNSDIFVVSVSGGEARKITGQNPANDLSPQYTPDGRYLAYRAQARPGFESDRWRLVLHDRKTNQAQSITEQMDMSIDGFTFSRDSQKIYFVAGERGRNLIFETGIGGGQARKVVSDSTNDDVQLTPDGKKIVFTRNSLSRPVEIFTADTLEGKPKQLTKTNEDFLSRFKLPAAEDVTWDGAGGSKIHGFLVKPPNFTTNRRWPMIVLIHGGPQGAWNDAWSYRWNPQLFAAAGYVVFSPNPRGSTGYGQRFVDEISGDWAGKVYTDLIKGVAHVSSLPYVDKERIGAAGGSYGGYMVNWILGHNDDQRVKFRALVSHAGVYNLTSMYGATEELWFPEWEFKGTPWTNPEMYSRWSPHLHVKNFKTPTLVIHGELDYRVPITEGLQLFTALQRQGVDSKLLYYPDEGHWILKPQNSELWYDTVLGWFDAHLGSRQ